jgi:hypothetical protein
MIKRYNQFVKGKVNEEFVMTGEDSDIDVTTPSTIPDTKPGRPGILPLTTPEIKDEPMGEFEGEVEEVGVDKYTDALQKLTDASGEDFEQVYNKDEKSVTVKGKKVSFPAETEKYHIEGVKKPFATLEEVLAYFESGVSPQARQEVRDEMSSIKDEEFLDREEQFESKSYKSKRMRTK